MGIDAAGLKANGMHAANRRRVSILGATGTIGDYTCELIAANPEDFDVVAVTANRNAAKLAACAISLGAKFAAIGDKFLEGELRAHLSGTGIECAGGAEALIEAGSRPADWIMAAIVGFAGLAPTLAALRQGTTIALANKECLVSAGPFFMAEATRHGATIIPVDSEHSAVFQALDDLECRHVEKIVLTASGGPFRTWTQSQIDAARPEDALKHPNWSMGQKITIDSATLMNKGLEIIEAFHLFNVRPDQLSAIIHPQSIIHALVYYSDASVLAQASLPDMRTPIAYSLAWPKRLEASFNRLDLASIGQLTFEEPDERRFPALALTRAALEEGGNAPTVLNAANEVAVQAFLEGKISFPGIAALVEQTLDGSRGSLANTALDSHEAVVHVDSEARAIAGEILVRNSRSGIPLIRASAASL